MLDQQSGAGAINGLETMASRQSRDHARMRYFRRGRAIDVILKVGEHLEMLGDIGIEGRQEVIQQPVAEQDHLHIERDRIGFERDRAREPYETTQLFDPDLPLAQRSLQGRPAERSVSRLRASSSRKPSLARCIAPALMRRKLVTQHAVVRDIFDAAQQIAQGGMQFFDDWEDGFAPGLANEDIDGVAVEWRFELVLQLRTFVTLALDHEQGDVFDEVGTNCFQMVQDFCKISKARFCRVTF